MVSAGLELQSLLCIASLCPLEHTEESSFVVVFFLQTTRAHDFFLLHFYRHWPQGLQKHISSFQSGTNIISLRDNLVRRWSWLDTLNVDHGRVPLCSCGSSSCCEVFYDLQTISAQLWNPSRPFLSTRTKHDTHFHSFVSSVILRIL